MTKQTTLVFTRREKPSYENSKEFFSGKKVVGVVKQKNKKKEKKQLYLDFGQKDLKTVFCSNCGMIYMNKLKEDVEVHEKYCKKQKDLISFTGWKNERCVKKLLNEDKIIEIRTNDSKIHLKKMEDVKKILIDQFGEQSEKDLSYDKIFIYVNSKIKKIVGVIFCKRIEFAFKLKENEISIEDKVNNILLGVSRIWVHTSQRRKGIAKELLDVASYHFIDGYPISKNEIAFSQTTNDGKLFAQSYCKKDDILIYK
eukprot:gene10185-2604_t